MTDDKAAEARDEQWTTIWTPRHPLLSVLTGVPGLALAAVFVGLLAFSVLEGAYRGVLVLAAIFAVVFSVRLMAWSLVAARRTVAVSATHLAVRAGGETVAEVAWDDTGSIDLARGDRLLKLMLSFATVTFDFPTIVPGPRDSDRPDKPFPGLLAILPAEHRRLAEALDQACTRRGVTFTGE